MNISVNIGSSQEFRLGRALLVYGTTSYDGYPPRHPFVILHEVSHCCEGARLEAGQLVTSQMLADLMAGLGRTVPLEILPERVLVRTAETIVWWMSAGTRVMFFSDRGGDEALKQLNGKVYPQPPLVFRASGTRLSVRALGEDRRPSPTTRLCMAPYWNCYDDGGCCTGSMRIPREKSVAAIDSWEQSFFGSEFTHAAGAHKRTRYRGGLLAMWQSLAGRKEFPSKYLVPLKETLGEFVNRDGHSNRNQIDGN